MAKKKGSKNKSRTGVKDPERSAAMRGNKNAAKNGTSRKKSSLAAKSPKIKNNYSRAFIAPQGMKTKNNKPEKLSVIRSGPGAGLQYTKTGLLGTFIDKKSKIATVYRYDKKSKTISQNIFDLSQLNSKQVDTFVNSNYTQI
jgi:hypothetical protein